MKNEPSHCRQPLGDVEGAVTRYLSLRLPQDAAEMWGYAPTMQDALDEISDPEFASVAREAVWFCWENGRPNYSPSRERRRFMQSYVAGRIPTARLLDEAWAACQATEKDALRDSVMQGLGGTEETRSSVPDLDGLSDEEIETLYHRTLKQVATDTIDRLA